MICPKAKSGTRVKNEERDRPGGKDEKGEKEIATPRPQVFASRG
jgi:hypothetical protein